MLTEAKHLAAGKKINCSQSREGAKFFPHKGHEEHEGCFSQKR
jgi:hypothetical protein